MPRIRARQRDLLLRGASGGGIRPEGDENAVVPLPTRLEHEIARVTAARDAAVEIMRTALAPVAAAARELAALPALGPEPVSSTWAVWIRAAVKAEATCAGAPPARGWRGHAAASKALVEALGGLLAVLVTWEVTDEQAEQAEQAGSYG